MSKKYILLFCVALCARLLALGLEWQSPNSISVSIQNAEAARHMLQGEGYAFDRARVMAIYEEQLNRGGLTDLKHFPLSEYPEKRVRPTFQYPVGYAASLAVLGGTQTFAYARIFQILIDCLACLWLAGLVSRLYGSRAAWIAGAVYALWLPSAISSVQVIPDAYAPFFAIGALDFFIRGVQSPGSHAWKFWLLSGVMSGLGGYFRPTFLLFGLAMGGMAFLLSRFSWRYLAAAATVFGITVLMLVPWAWRNHQLTGRWMFTSSIGGYALWEGLGDFSNPWGIEASDWLAKEFVEAHGYEWYSPESDLLLKSEFKKNIRANPGIYVSHIVKRYVKVLTARSYYGLNRRAALLTPRPSSLGQLPGWMFSNSVPLASLLVWRLWNLLELMLVFLAIGGFFKRVEGLGERGFVLKAPLFGAVVYFATLAATIHYHPRYLIASIPCYIVLASPLMLEGSDFVRRKIPFLSDPVKSCST